MSDKLFFTLHSSIPNNRIFLWWIGTELPIYRRSSNIDLLSL